MEIWAGSRHIAGGVPWTVKHISTLAMSWLEWLPKTDRSRWRKGTTKSIVHFRTYGRNRFGELINAGEQRTKLGGMLLKWLMMRFKDEVDGRDFLFNSIKAGRHPRLHMLIGTNLSMKAPMIHIVSEGSCRIRKTSWKQKTHRKKWEQVLPKVGEESLDSNSHSKFIHTPYKPHPLPYNRPLTHTVSSLTNFFSPRTHLPFWAYGIKP